MNPIITSLFKAIKPQIPHLLPDMMSQLEAFLVDYLNGRQKMANEVMATFMLLTGTDGQMYIMTTYFDEADTITRIEDKQPLTDFVNRFIQKIM